MKPARCYTEVYFSGLPMVLCRLIAGSCWRQYYFSYPPVWCALGVPHRFCSSAEEETAAKSSQRYQALVEELVDGKSSPRTVTRRVSAPSPFLRMIPRPESDGDPTPKSLFPFTNPEREVDRERDPAHGGQQLISKSGTDLESDVSSGFEKDNQELEVQEGLARKSNTMKVMGTGLQRAKGKVNYEPMDLGGLKSEVEGKISISNVVANDQGKVSIGEKCAGRRDRWGSIPSVTRILKQTMSLDQQFLLSRWRRRMIAQLGEEGFKHYQKRLFHQGQLLHLAVEALLSNQDPKVKLNELGEPQVLEKSKEDSAALNGLLRSLEPVMSMVTDIQAIEVDVQHPKLGYHGYIDCLARFRGDLCAIDWKSSERQKRRLRDLFDNPLQVIAYAGAVNYDPNFDCQVERALVVVAYRDGTPANALFMNESECDKAWRQWLCRLEEFLLSDGDKSDRVLTNFELS